MAGSPNLRDQIQQLEAQVPFVEAQASTFDSRLAAASADERAALRQEEQLLQHQLIALREQLATLQQQYRMQQPLQGLFQGPRRTGRFYLLLRCLFTAAALAFIAYVCWGHYRYYGWPHPFVMMFAPCGAWKTISCSMHLSGPVEWIVMLIEWVLLKLGYHHCIFW